MYCRVHPSAIGEPSQWSPAMVCVAHFRSSGPIDEAIRAHCSTVNVRPRPRALHLATMRSHSAVIAGSMQALSTASRMHLCMSGYLQPVAFVNGRFTMHSTMFSATRGLKLFWRSPHRRLQDSFSYAPLSHVG